MAPLVSRFGRFSPPAAWGRSEILIAEIPELGDRPPPLHVGDVWSPSALLTGVRVDVQGFRPVVVVAASHSPSALVKRSPIRSCSGKMATASAGAGGSASVPP